MREHEQRFMKFYQILVQNRNLILKEDILGKIRNNKPGTMLTLIHYLTEQFQRLFIMQFQSRILTFKEQLLPNFSLKFDYKFSTDAQMGLEHDLI